ncbi:MAG: hypothetical protein KF823_11225 [Xanthomonadales bacterium]|nr:hypothetical protein [Xanthomonadales bacterium]
MPAHRLPVILGLAALLTACSGGDGGTAPGPGDRSGEAAVGAGRAEPGGFNVAEVQMARTFDSGGGPVSEPATRFAPDDLIEAVILTEGKGGGTIAARWRFGHDGPVFHEEAHRIEEAGVHAFRIAKADGFPPGDYQVDILLDDALSVSRRFQVED